MLVSRTWLLRRKPLFATGMRMNSHARYDRDKFGMSVSASGLAAKFPSPVFEHAECLYHGGKLLFAHRFSARKTMIELTPADASVILRLAGSRELDYLPTAELNEDGKNEIIRWIESVGRTDDQLSPYAWFSLAEDAANSNGPDQAITIEMLPTYALSGDAEILELSREEHFDWSIEAVPVEFIENAEELLDTGAPVRFLMLAEAAGGAFARRVSELCPGMEDYEPQLLARATNAFFVGLCEGAGIVLDDDLLTPADDDLDYSYVDRHELQDAMTEAAEDACDVILSLDPDIGSVLPDAEAILEMDWLKA